MVRVWAGVKLTEEGAQWQAVMNTLMKLCSLCEQGIPTYYRVCVGGLTLGNHRLYTEV
jgi:hypothetical protein